MTIQAGILEFPLILKHPRAERRACVRYHVTQDAISRPIDEPGALSWGATVQSLSTTGIGLHLCFPFKPDAMVAIELQSRAGPRWLAAKVVHVADQPHGIWFVGCSFIAPLSEDELDDLL